MLILWLKVEVVLGEWPRRKRRRREPEPFEDDFHGVFECHAEDVGGLRKGDGRGIGVDGGHLVLDAGAGHDDLAAFLAAEFRVEPDFLALAAFPEPFGGVVAHVVFKIHAGGPHGVDGLAGEMVAKLVGKLRGCGELDGAGAHFSGCPVDADNGIGVFQFIADGGAVGHPPRYHVIHGPCAGDTGDGQRIRPFVHGGTA